MSATALPLDQRVIEAAVELELARQTKPGDDRQDPRGPRRLLLVHGEYPRDAPRRLLVQGRSVSVRSCDSVLGMYEAWNDHLGTADGDALLVLATPLADEQIGLDLLAQAMHREVQRVERWELVRQRFGVREVESRLRRSGWRWLAEALIAAEPDGGWPRTTAVVLDHSTALRALARARLGLPTDTVDSEELLTWSLDADAVARYSHLGAEEREGIRSWLVETVGVPARVLFAFVGAGSGTDSMAAGVLGTVLWDPECAQDPELARVAGRLEMLLRGSVPNAEDLHAFAGVVAGVLLRWIGEAAGQGPRATQARRQTDYVLDQAERLAREYGAEPFAERNRYLRSGLHSRLRILAQRLAEGRVAEAARALHEVEDHAYSALESSRVAPAQMAVRLLRRRDSNHAGPALAPDTVAAGLDAYLRDLGWIDRALITLRAGDPVSDNEIAGAYREITARAQGQLDASDREFADRLAAWSPHAAPSPGLLCIEDVLTRVAEPLAHAATDSGFGAPLMLVLDGMNGAIAVELAEQLQAEGWDELVFGPGRAAALAMIPSVTRISRASLLTGTRITGDQKTEASGFARFWRERRRTGALFHKADITGPDGARLATRLVQALADSDSVVAVVLNTIDDALADDRMGERTGWRVADITHLALLLDAAKSYGRPVILVSDHGHVLHRGTARTRHPGAPAGRWHTGEPGEGEVSLTGPRVLEGDGTVTVPWRGDLHYQSKAAGYHGGAALAEMTVPVLVFSPLRDNVPDGWRRLPAEDAAPLWWKAPNAVPAATRLALPQSPTAQSDSTPRPRAGAKPKRVESPGQATAFELPPAAGGRATSGASSTTLGGQLIASRVYKDQIKALRRKPDDERIAALIDALAAAGNRLSAAKALEVMGTPAARLEGTFAILQRILNVETYPVLKLVDGRRTAELDPKLLREQFGLQLDD